MLIVRGGNGSSSMSSTEWMIASQVIRSRCGSRIASRLLGQRGVLDEGVREALGDQAIEARIGRLVDDRAAVLALQVDRLDAAELRELSHQSLVPRAPRVELELEPRVQLEPATYTAHVRRVAQAHRDDEPHRPRLPLDQPRPANAPPGAEPDRAPRSRRPSGGSRGRRPCRARAGRARAGPGAARTSPAGACPQAAGRHLLLEERLIFSAVGDVLADALLAAAAKANDGRDPRELRRHLLLEPLEGVRLQLELEIGD